jgi:hypothetical protein
MHEGQVRFIGVPSMTSVGMIWRAECTAAGCDWRGEEHGTPTMQTVASAALADARRHEYDKGD